GAACAAAREHSAPVAFTGIKSMNAEARNAPVPVAATTQRAADSPAPLPTTKRLITAGLVATGAGLLIYGSYALWHGVTPFEKTDNAYIKGDLTFVSTKVPGFISEVLTENHQRVAPGQVIVRIDPRDFEAAERDARASVARERAALI